MKNTFELDTKVLIKKLLAHANLSMAKAIELVNELHPDSQLTVQNISNKMSRGTLRFSEVVNIASVCGYSIKFEPIENTQKDDISQKESIEGYNPLKNFQNKCLQGFSFVDSPNFTEGVSIAGKNATQAAEYLSKRLTNDMPIQREIKLHDEVCKNFSVSIMAVPPDNAWENEPDPEEL